MAEARRGLIVVARGERRLLARLRHVFRGAGLEIIENRRRDPTLLPREGREGRPYLAPSLTP